MPVSKDLVLAIAFMYRWICTATACAKYLVSDAGSLFKNAKGYKLVLSVCPSLSNPKAQVVLVVRLHDKQVHHMLLEVTLLKTESYFETFAHRIRQVFEMQQALPMTVSSQLFEPKVLQL